MAQNFLGCDRDQELLVPPSLLLICAGARASSDTASKAFPRTPNIVLVAF
jgi:hypothetical protein